MSVFEKVLKAVFPQKCRFCGGKLKKGDRALCRQCRAEYENAKHRICQSCRKKQNQCDCTPKRSDPGIVRTLTLFRYKKNTPGGALILSVKDRKDKDALELLSDDLAKSLKRYAGQGEDCVVTNVPRAKKALRKTGVDQAAELAKRTSKKCGMPYLKCIKHIGGGAKQKKLGSEERLTHAEESYAFGGKREEIAGKRVILIDDVITTGATTAVCAKLLRENGAKQIVVLCAGRA